MAPPSREVSFGNVTTIQSKQTKQIVVDSLKGAGLRARVLDLLGTAPTYEGFHFDLLVSELAPASEAALRSCLTSLCAEGEVYSAPAEGHFALVGHLAGCP